MNDAPESSPLSRSQERRHRTTSYSHFAFAFFVMGGWSWYINYSHGLVPAARASLVQGTASVVMTLVIRRAIDALHRGSRVHWLMSPVIVCIGTALLLIACHSLARTPNISATIAFPWSMSVMYAFGYAASLHRMQQRSSH